MWDIDERGMQAPCCALKAQQELLQSRRARRGSGPRRDAGAGCAAPGPAQAAQRRPQRLARWQAGHWLARGPTCIQARSCRTVTKYTSGLVAA